jgi:hypothetical protein
MREKAEHDIIGGEKAGKKNDIIRGKTAEFLNRKHSGNPREMGTVQYETPNEQKFRSNIN